jgi:hypothetical protein
VYVHHMVAAEVVVPHTRSRSCLRLKTNAGLEARVASRSNCRAVSGTSSSPSRTSRRARSIVSSPNFSGASSSAASRLPGRGLRSIALIRATSSPAEKGLVR